jgi:hypothetical protein
MTVRIEDRVTIAIALIGRGYRLEDLRNNIVQVVEAIDGSFEGTFRMATRAERFAQPAPEPVTKQYVEQQGADLTLKGVPHAATAVLETPAPVDPKARPVVATPESFEGLGIDQENQYLYLYGRLLTGKPASALVNTITYLIENKGSVGFGEIAKAIFGEDTSATRGRVSHAIFALRNKLSDAGIDNPDSVIQSTARGDKKTDGYEVTFNPTFPVRVF